MLFKIFTVTGLTLTLALPVAAQSTQSQSGSSSSSGQQSGMGSQANMNIRQHVTQSLEQAGFTDVHVMPESFLVRAKDKQGQPVMMLINPDSITAVTEAGGSGQAGASGAKGSGLSNTQ